MTTNDLMTAPLDSLARIADAYYSDLTTLADFTDYMRDEMMIDRADSITDFESLSLALMNDIHDLIHNANILDLIPAADMLADDEIDAFSDRIDSDEFIDALARIILTRIS